MYEVTSLNFSNDYSNNFDILKNLAIKNNEQIHLVITTDIGQDPDDEIAILFLLSLPNTICTVHAMIVNLNDDNNSYSSEIRAKYLKTILNKFKESKVKDCVGSNEIPVYYIDTSDNGTGTKWQAEKNLNVVYKTLIDNNVQIKEYHQPTFINTLNSQSNSNKYNYTFLGISAMYPLNEIVPNINRIKEVVLMGGNNDVRSYLYSINEIDSPLNSDEIKRRITKENEKINKDALSVSDDEKKKFIDDRKKIKSIQLDVPNLANYGVNNNRFNAYLQANELYYYCYINNIPLIITTKWASAEVLMPITNYLNKNSYVINRIKNAQEQDVPNLFFNVPVFTIQRWFQQFYFGTEQFQKNLIIELLNKIIDYWNELNKNNLNFQFILKISEDTNLNIPLKTLLNVTESQKTNYTKLIQFFKTTIFNDVKYVNWYDILSLVACFPCLRKKFLTGITYRQNKNLIIYGPMLDNNGNDKPTNYINCFKNDELKNEYKDFLASFVVETDSKLPSHLEDFNPLSFGKCLKRSKKPVKCLKRKYFKRRSYSKKSSKKFTKKYSKCLKRIKRHKKCLKYSKRSKKL